ncbi:hypothetical protein M0G43_10010 [Subsaxibacter sp. CAU 1640]|uniref:hypothetical protein n=1 Tax=Subsaxibacter sp. CAU 1640 TaxID=2933271 RepID=UPI002006A908|nr:hypothetical protein [Subsaxibacter sp. CAU 1640]MCK7590905.1 hypothetical protein [Subsaxibacter sp. CAU 1640]
MSKGSVNLSKGNSNLSKGSVNLSKANSNLSKGCAKKRLKTPVKPKKQPNNATKKSSFKLHASRSNFSKNIPELVTIHYHSKISKIRNFFANL